MKTIPVRGFGTPHVGVAPPAPVSYLRSTALRVVTDPASLRLQQALARMGDLEQALASSQQEAIAAQQQVEILTKANAQLRGLAVRPERELARSAAQCATWKPTDCCLFASLDSNSAPHIERLLAKRIQFRKGSVLYRAGDRFDKLYAIHAGSCKTVLLARDGQDQIAGYHMAGEIIGMDGIGTDVHGCQATALEEMDVCPLPFDEIENLARLNDQFRQNLQKLLSREGARAHSLMILLGTMRAEQRLAVFLLDLSHRYRERGYSSCEFVLRMTREEIGNYLGLTLETVSRVFSRFQREGMIQVQGRTVKLLDRMAVAQVIDCGI
jgi:CRP/FNR family transcriptional regulator, anaerobic regulatory protein